MELFSGNAVIHFVGLLSVFSLFALGIMSVSNRGYKHLVKEAVYTILGILVSGGLFLVFNIVWDDFVKSGKDTRLLAAYLTLGSMGFMLIRTVAHAIATKELLSWKKRYNNWANSQEKTAEEKTAKEKTRCRKVIVLGDGETWDYLNNCVCFSIAVDGNGVPYGGVAAVENMVRYVQSNGNSDEVEIDSFERAS